MTINTRKSHIKRCLGVIKNSSGGTDPDPDSFLDILRTEEFDYRTSDGQEYRFILKWSDDTLKEDADDYDNESKIVGRKTELGKGTDPELPFVKDPSQYVPFRVIKELVIKDSDIGQEITFVFKNHNRTEDGDPIPTTREIDTIRLYHSDTIVDKELNDPEGTHIVKDTDYALKPDTQDKAQYADAEVIRRWTHIMHATDKQHIDGQEIEVILHNTELYDAILGLSIQDSISPGFNSSGVQTIAGRLDPFQNIINAQWSITQEAVLASAALPFTTDLELPSTTEISGDGTTWDPGFDSPSSNAASGLGYTVVCAGRKFVVFGKPKNGDACFICASHDKLERGVLDSEGNLVWTTVHTITAPSNVSFGFTSCSFAGDAFFASYITDDTYETTVGDSNVVASVNYLAVSFDGQTFARTEPFRGVVDVIIGTGGDLNGNSTTTPISGTVAYDKDNKRYCTTGAYQRNYVGQEDIGAGETVSVRFIDDNFMSSISSDGLTWTPKFDISEGSGLGVSSNGSTDIGAVGSTSFPPRVCWSEGKFRASSSFKMSNPFFGGPTFVVYNSVQYAAAVATSSDGISWTNNKLPGAFSNPFGFGNAGGGGDGAQIMFFKKPKAATPTSPASKGFFVTIGFEYNNDSTNGFQRSTIWRSDDGDTWTKVRTDNAKGDWLLSAVNKGRGKIVTH